MNTEDYRLEIFRQNGHLQVAMRVLRESDLGSDAAKYGDDLEGDAA